MSHTVIIGYLMASSGVAESVECLIVIAKLVVRCLDWAYRAAVFLKITLNAIIQPDTEVQHSGLEHMLATARFFS